MGNDVDMRKMAKIYEKWLKYLTNDLNMWEMTLRFWEMAKIFGKWLIYMGHGMNLRYGISMLQMT